MESEELIVTANYSSPVDIKKYIRIHDTLIEMLEDRGYLIPQNEKKTKSNMEEFMKKYEAVKEKEKFTTIWESMTTLYKHKLNDSLLYVRFINPVTESKEIGGGVIDKVINDIKVAKDNYSNMNKFLLIVPQKISSNSLSKLQHFQTPSSNLSFQIFMDKELYFNITKHMLVPEHILLEKNQQYELYKELKSRNPSSAKLYLPKIYDTDPISKYYDANPGQVFKIIRKSLFDDVIAKDSIFYRIVVKTPAVKV
jgi:DNA-directed RNA polymerase I, II, and III subunit RPABC1